MDVGKNIREAREGQGLLVSEVARRAGLTVSGVTSIETGRVRSPSVDTVVKIARALGVSPADLLREEATPKVVALPTTPFTNLDPEQIDERLRALESAAQAEKLLRAIEAEARDLEQFFPRHVAPKLDRARLYTATALDRWLKLADTKRDPSSNRFKGVAEIDEELGGQYARGGSRKNLVDEESKHSA